MRRNGLLLVAIEGKLKGQENSAEEKEKYLDDLRWQSYRDLKAAAEHRQYWVLEFHSIARCMNLP